ncbi:MAG TPA: ABC transporter permease [Mycobacteriales bacterium]|nr:ABC transporter permease [Mycobacteriales bacterium]
MTTVVEPQHEAPAPAGTAVEREFTVQARSQREQIISRFLHNKQAMTGLIVFAILVVGAFVGPLVYRWNYTDIDLSSKSVGIGSPHHILGTQELGRDLLALLMRGVQRSALIVAIVVGIAGCTGVLVGSIAGYYGRWIDNLLMRLVDLILTLPGLIVITVVAASIPSARSAIGVGIILGAFGWLDLARLIRAQFLSLREREFVEAAHAMGASDRRIIFRHLIPNALGSIIVWATLAAAIAVLAEAALTYLGYGIQGDDTSLGRLVSDGVAAADSRPWLFYVPGLLLMILVMCINLIGDGIRDAFDPSHKRVRS